MANFISLLCNKENRSNEIISPKIALGKYLANAKFGIANCSTTKSRIRQGLCTPLEDFFFWLIRRLEQIGPPQIKAGLRYFIIADICLKKKS